MAKKGEKLKEETKIKMSISKRGELNPMKRTEVKLKSSNSHKGKIPWNKNLNGIEFIKHYKNGKVCGGRKKGYKHKEESKIKMSLNTLGKKHNITFSAIRKKQMSDMLKKQRQDYNFNKKMFESLKRSITKPHIKVKNWIDKYSNLKTTSNYTFSVGNRYGSIDEADIERKIAIFIDGNYWHNYPLGRKWDRCCDTCLQNKGWKVIRFWESDINKNSEIVIDKIKSLNLLSL